MKGSLIEWNGTRGAGGQCEMVLSAVKESSVRIAMHP